MAEQYQWLSGRYGIGTAAPLLLWSNTPRLFVNKTPMVNSAMLGVSTSRKELAIEYALDSGQCQGRGKLLLDQIEANLLSAGYEVLVDDRNERAGVNSATAIWLGHPIQCDSYKKAAEGIVEVKIKATGDTIEVHAG